MLESIFNSDELEESKSVVPVKTNPFFFKKMDQMDEYEIVAFGEEIRVTWSYVFASGKKIFKFERKGCDLFEEPEPLDFDIVSSSPIKRLYWCGANYVSKLRKDHHIEEPTKIGKVNLSLSRSSPGLIRRHSDLLGGVHQGLRKQESRLVVKSVKIIVDRTCRARILVLLGWAFKRLR